MAKRDTTRMICLTLSAKGLYTVQDIMEFQRIPGQMKPRTVKKWMRRYFPGCEVRTINMRTKRQKVSIPRHVITYD